MKKKTNKKYIIPTTMNNHIELNTMTNRIELITMDNRIELNTMINRFEIEPELFDEMFREIAMYIIDRTKRANFTITEDKFVGEQNTENAEECTICMERNCNLVSVKCNHSFCRECIQSWADTHHDTCPLCRTQLETFKHIKVKDQEQEQV